MITSAQLDDAAAQLGLLAAALDDVSQRYGDAHRDATAEVAGLHGLWAGPRPDAVTAATESYVAAVDGSPIPMASDTASRWRRSASDHADAVRALEVRRDALLAQLAAVNPWAPGLDDEQAGRLEARRSELRSGLTAVDQDFEEAQAAWDRCCAAFAAELDTYTAALRARAAVSAIAALAAAAGGLAWLGTAVMSGWLAALSSVQLVALLQDKTFVETWWSGLTDEERIAFVVANPAAVTGTLADIVEEWKAQLDSEELREYYTAQALARAGIDSESWDPAQGFDANRENVFAVYDYYSSLYLENPDMFWWAGMASMIGPSFVAGMADLSATGGFAEGVEQLSEIAGYVPGLPPGLAAVAGMSADDLEGELEFYETTMLSMQREIFLDMAVAHEAYLDGGMEAIERLYEDDPYGNGARAVDAWSMIDEGRATGNADLVAEGNRLLLEREQRDVIQDDYDRMYERPVTGPVMTYLFTAVGAPSIPGADSYPEVFPAELSAGVSNDDVLGPIHDAVSPVEVEAEVTIGTPLPNGNIATFQDRWELIENDTLPAYEELVTEDPEQVEEILSTPVEDRFEAHRIEHRIDDVVTNWEVSVGVDAHVDGSIWRTAIDGAQAIGDALFGGDGGGPTGPVDVPTATTSTTIADPASEPSPSSDSGSSPPVEEDDDGDGEGPATGTTVPPTVPEDSGGS